jgi:hypothetical protein
MDIMIAWSVVDHGFDLQLCQSKEFNIGICSFSAKNAACAGFTYRLDRLKPRASNVREPPAKVYNIF